MEEMNINTKTAIAEGVDALTLNPKELNESEVADGIEAIVAENDEDVVNPWNVASTNDTGIDYDKLISIYNFNYIHFINFICI